MKLWLTSIIEISYLKADFKYKIIKFIKSRDGEG